VTPADFYTTVLEPAAVLLPPHLDSPEARMLLFAIAGQESSWSNRMQTPVAYAHGFWQCEHGGGVQAVLTHPQTRPVILRLCDTYAINSTDSQVVFDAITYHDPLAYGVARLILLPDPEPLPAVGDSDTAWSYYARNWRPGRPRPGRWEQVYLSALAAFPRKS